MGAFFTGLWAKLAAAAAIVAAIGLFLFRVFRAGGDAERAKTAKAAFDHQQETSKQVSKADETLADPHADRARRVRDRFSRD